jgi:hypothetical protein
MVNASGIGSATKQISLEKKKVNPVEYSFRLSTATKKRSLKPVVIGSNPIDEGNFVLAQW